MQLKITRSGGRRYLQLVQAFRDSRTGRPRQKHIASLGRLEPERYPELEALISGLLKAMGRSPVARSSASPGTPLPPPSGPPTRVISGLLWCVHSLLADLGLGDAVQATVAGDGERLVVDRLLGHATVPPPAALAQWTALASRVGPRLAENLEADRLYCTIVPLRVWTTSPLKHPFNIFECHYHLALVTTPRGRPVAIDTEPDAGRDPAALQRLLLRLGQRLSVGELVACVPVSRVTPSLLTRLGRLRLPGAQEARWALTCPLAACAEAAAVWAARPAASGSSVNGEEMVESTAFGHRGVLVADAAERKDDRRNRARRVARALRLARRLTRTLEAQDRGLAVADPLTDRQARDLLAAELADLGLTDLLGAHLDGGEYFTWFWRTEGLRQQLEVDGVRVVLSNAAEPSAGELAALPALVTDYSRRMQLVVPSDVPPRVTSTRDGVMAIGALDLLSSLVLHELGSRLGELESAFSRDEAIALLNEVSLLESSSNEDSPALVVPSSSRRRALELAAQLGVPLAGGSPAA